MLLTEEIEIHITPRNMNHFVEKGYTIPKKYSEKSKREVLDSEANILIKIKDLPNSSHKRIKYSCDNCSRVFETSYCDWLNTKYKELGDLCKECAIKIKLPKAMQDKYGENNCSKVDSIEDKKKRTNIEKYGKEWAIASEEVKNKIIKAYFETYGVKNPMQKEEVKAKAKKTNNIRYGGNSPMCCEAVKSKSLQTCLERYGVSNPAKSKEIQAKTRKTLYENGNVPSSKAEKEMCSILKELFGENNCFPNYPEGNLSLDCLVVVDNILIDFEYDGLYWHKNRKQYDYARNSVLMDLGYKIVRIKANNKDDMPTKENLKEAVDCLVKDNQHLYFIDMND